MTGAVYYSGSSEILGETEWAWSLPCLVVVLASAVLPICWSIPFVRRWRQHASRRRVGLCRRCGYDLRATPEEGGALLDRCPECGAVAGAEGTA